jgi:flagellar hook-associated protein 3 FlgL
LALQLSNDSYSGTDRTVAAEEVRSLFRNAIGVLNTRVGNRYIFAGFQDDQPAFDGTGLYQGDSGVRQIEAFPGSMTTVSIPGDEVATGAAGGPDILESLRTLETSLTGNDVATLRGTLTMFDDGIEHLSLARAKLGASSNNLIAAIDTARGNVMTEKANVSRLAEVDVIESASRLALAQRALEAALTASARSFDLSLLHKLG